MGQIEARREASARASRLHFCGGRLPSSATGSHKAQRREAKLHVGMCHCRLVYCLLQDEFKGTFWPSRLRQRQPGERRARSTPAASGPTLQLWLAPLTLFQAAIRRPRRDSGLRSGSALAKPCLREAASNPQQVHRSASNAASSSRMPWFCSNETNEGSEAYCTVRELHAVKSCA